MRNENRHLSLDEFLHALEETEEESPHLLRCEQCRQDLRGLESSLVLLRRVWNPRQLRLPAAHVVLREAQRLEATKGRLFSATAGWFALLIIAAGLICVSNSFLPRVVEVLVSLHADVGIAGLIALIMIVLGLAVSPVVVLLGDSRVLERSFVQ